MTRHLAKLLDAIWYLAMGLFLGLTGGMVLSVILIFRGARKLDATPGVEPFSDPRFAEYHNEAVAGYIGQNLFMIGGTVALVLLSIAMIARVTNFAVSQVNQKPLVGIRLCSIGRSLLLIFCVLCMIVASWVTTDMNASWPELYDKQASEKQLTERRDLFEYAHKLSEKFASYAWLSGFIALGISPWCRRIADTPLQSSDGDKEKDNQEKTGQAQEA